MIVLGGQPANFNYVAFDGATGLYVAGILVDVTTGSPVFVGSPIAMTDMGGGVYIGEFTPVMGHSYLVISAIYEDAGFTTPSPNRPPAADNFDAFVSDTNLINFNYATYDENDLTTINATVFDITDSTQSTFGMTHVALGVYMGQFLGTSGKQYFVEKIPTNSAYTPGADSFQCFTFGTVQIVQLFAATLTGQSSSAKLKGQSLTATLVES